MKLKVFFVLMVLPLFSVQADFTCHQILGDEKTQLLAELNENTSFGFKEHLTRVHERVQRLLKAYPPETHFLVGWGINTAVEAAVLKYILGDQFDSYYMQVPIQLRHREIQRISDEERINIFSHFMPDTQKLKNRKIVFSRNLVSGGQAIENTGAMINTFFLEKFSEIQFDFTITTGVPLYVVRGFAQNLSSDVYIGLNHINSFGLERIYHKDLQGENEEVTLRKNHNVDVTFHSYDQREYNYDSIALYRTLYNYGLVRAFTFLEAKENIFIDQNNAKFEFLFSIVVDLLEDPNFSLNREKIELEIFKNLEVYEMLTLFFQKEKYVSAEEQKNILTYIFDKYLDLNDDKKNKVDFRFFGNKLQNKFRTLDFDINKYAEVYISMSPYVDMFFRQQFDNSNTDIYWKVLKRRGLSFLLELPATDNEGIKRVILNDLMEKKVSDQRYPSESTEIYLEDALEICVKWDLACPPEYVEKIFKEFLFPVKIRPYNLKSYFYILELSLSDQNKSVIQQELIKEKIVFSDEIEDTELIDFRYMLEHCLMTTYIDCLELGILPENVEDYFDKIHIKSDSISFNKESNLYRRLFDFYDGLSHKKKRGKLKEFYLLGMDELFYSTLKNIKGVLVSKLYNNSEFEFQKMLDEIIEMHINKIFIPDVHKVLVDLFSSPKYQNQLKQVLGENFEPYRNMLSIPLLNKRID